MPALISYAIARTGEGTPNNVVAYELPAVYVTPLAVRNNNVKAWASADESMGGGAGVFPAEGDVDVTAGAYGPGGAEYQGTLVQPSEADVKVGVGYGAGGTEHTGSYSPPAGGNTYSRGRVVNA